MIYVHICDLSPLSAVCMFCKSIDWQFEDEPLNAENCNGTRSLQKHRIGKNKSSCLLFPLKKEKSLHASF